MHGVLTPQLVHPSKDTSLLGSTDSTISHTFKSDRNLLVWTYSLVTYCTRETINKGFLVGNIQTSNLVSVKRSFDRCLIGKLGGIIRVLRE